MQNEYNHIFDEHWSLYQKILSHNYMGHDQVFSVLSEHVLKTFGTNSYSLLDIGCGDAQTVCKYIANTNIKSFTGVDLSKQALTHAKNYVGQLKCKGTFIQKDFQKALHDLLDSKIQFDVIFSGFALHHLSEDEKINAFSIVRNLLCENGKFYYIDVVSEEDESREDYLDRYLSKPNKEWDALTASELSLLNEHVRSSDYPSTRANLQDSAVKAGFNTSECLFYDYDHANVLIVMSN